MREFLTLGSAPFEEDCVQVNPDEDYLPAMVKEVKKFVQFLDNRFLNIPDSAYFGVRSDNHDFGTYKEAAIYYDSDDKESEQFAMFVESHLPALWNDERKIDWKASQVPAGWDVID